MLNRCYCRCERAQEFEAWLREVKKIANFNGPKYELKNLFKEFAEDYNTVTLPHKKYEQPTKQATIRHPFTPIT